MESFKSRKSNCLYISVQDVPNSLQKGEPSGDGCTPEACLSWQARCAVLSALATYLHASPSVQRAAVRKWEPVAALFGLLWDSSTRKIALSMVHPLHLQTYFAWNRLCISVHMYGCSYRTEQISVPASSLVGFVLHFTSSKLCSENVWDGEITARRGKASGSFCTSV